MQLQAGPDRVLSTMSDAWLCLDHLNHHEMSPTRAGGDNQGSGDCVAADDTRPVPHVELHVIQLQATWRRRKVGLLNWSQRSA